VRKTPRVVGKLEEAKNSAKNIINPLAKINNIIFLAKAGRYLGVTTGRQTVDTGTDQGTLFIEVVMGALDAKLNHILVNVWVASSQIKTESKPGFKPTAAQLYAITQAAYSNTLSGIGADTNYKSELVLKTPFASVLTPNEQFVEQIYGKGLILGFKDSEYANKSGERFFVFVTVAGNKLMISVNEVEEKKIAA